MSKICLHLILVFITIVLVKLSETLHCKEDIFIKECTKKSELNWEYEKKIYRRKAYSFSVAIHSNCSYKTITYEWTIADKNGRDIIPPDNKKNVFVLQPFTLEINDYALFVNMSLNGIYKVEDPIYCEIFIVSEPPLAIIQGGTERIVEAGRSFLVDGSKSVDRNVKPNQPGKLVYKWNCDVIEGNDNKHFCANEFNEKSIKVPAEYAVAGYKYFFVLFVSADSWNYVSSTNQTIIILKNVVELEITCEKNCPPASSITNSKDITFLKAKCLSNCKNIDEKSFKWTVEDNSNFNYKENTQFGQNSDKFIIKAGVLQSGTKYKIRLSLIDGRTGSSMKIIETHTPPKIDSCTVKPSEGKAIMTKFSVDCKYRGSPSMFEIYTSNNGKKVQIARNTHLTDLKFSLPTNTKNFIKIVDDEGSFDEYLLTVNVGPAFTKGSIEEIKQQTEILKKLVNINSFEEAVQIANGVIEEMEKKSNTDLAKQIKKDILQSFEEYSINSHEDAKQIASIVARVVNDSEAKSDPYQGEIATKICKRASEVNQNHYEKEFYPTAQAPEVKEVTNTLITCGDTDSKENFDILQGTTLPIVMTTPFPLLSIPVIKEDYPDYLDDSIMDKTQKYEKISENVVDICTRNLNMMVLTVVKGEKPMNSSTKFSSVEIASDIGAKFAGHEIETKAASILPSNDFKSVTEKISVMVCSWNKNPFWWNPHESIVSSVILLKMVQNEKSLLKFKQPNVIIFKLQETDVQKQIQIHEIEKLGELTIVKVDVKGQQNFFVRFYNITTSDSIWVSISNFSKPSVDEIRKHAPIVNSSNTILHQEYDRNYDSWHYISLVPNKLKGQKFWISVYTKSCYHWNTSKKKWEFSCKGSQNFSNAKLECYCNHLSILAGMVRNNRIKEDKLLYKPDFELILICSHIIFISVCVVFYIYCIALLFIPKMIVKKLNMYFPADSASSSLYLYLVRIRTGGRPRSGTSSTICIKIFGEKYNSRSHVLNHPDPHRRIFSKSGEDWFIIPIRHHLGNVEKISIWSDYSGRSPSWFCSNIRIYDLQTGQDSFFELNTWLCLPPDGQLYVTVATTDETLQKRDILTILLKLWPRRSHQATFTILAKTTLLLSIILTIFLSSLFLYGLPMLEMRDGFAWVNNYDLHPHVILIALISSLASLIIHAPLILLFQYTLVVCTFLLIYIFTFRNSGIAKKFSTKVTSYCWIFLTFNILISITVLTIFGFWVPLVTAWLWLTSVAIALVMYLFIFENIFEKIYNHFNKTNKDVEFVPKLKDILNFVEAQRRYLFNKFGEDLLRPYLTHLYQPMDDEEIERKKLLEKSRLNLVALMEDMLMFICYTALLFLAIFANKNRLAAREHQEILDILEGKHTRTSGTDTIKSFPSFYDYINSTLLLSLQGKQWYGKYVVDNPGMTVDFSNKVLGVVRLRQKRVILRPCKVPNILKFFVKNQNCRKEFWSSKSNFSNFNSTYNASRLLHVWSYTRAKVAGISVVVGKFGIYTGGGFIAPLGRTLYNSYVNLDYLKNSYWLDSATSVIFVEFVTYNVNSNLFCDVRILVERSATGYYRVRTNVKATQLLFNKDEDTRAQTVIFTSFCLIVLIFTIKIISRLWKGKLFYVRDLWILVDILIVGLSYGCFSLFIYRAELVRRFLERLAKAKKNEFLKYFSLFQEDLTFTLVAALLVFVSTVRLWRLCRFATIFKITEKTIALSFYPILMIMICHMILFVAFSCYGYMMFGGVFEHFKDIRDTLVTLFLQSVGLNSDFDTTELLSTDPVMWGLYYSAYMVVCQLIFTVYIAVIMIYYYEARQMYSGENDFDDFKHFLHEELIHYKTRVRVIAQRLTGGADSKRPREYVTPKSDEIRFAGCMTIDVNKIARMRYVAIHTLRKNSLSLEKKIQLMNEISLCLWDKNQVELFYRERNECNKMEIIHDAQLQKMERVVQRILGANAKKKTNLKKRYERTVRRQLNKLDFVEKMLNSMLRIINNIDVK